MKRILGILIACFSIMLWAGVALSVPVNLSTFTADPFGPVSESGGVVTFTEDATYAAIYFYDDNFFVENDATILSFDYDFQLGLADYDDYLTFELNYSPELDIGINVTGGHFEIDLSPYQGSSISLAWGLIWDGDWNTDTTAGVYNIDLATDVAPIPEPCTLILMATGLVGLFGIRRKKFLRIS